MEIEKNNKLLEEQEKKRAEEFKMKDAKIKAFVKFTAETVGKKEIEKKQEEEKRFLKDLINKEKREQIEEDKKKNKQKQLEVNLRKYLEEQKKEKEKRKIEELQKNKELAEEWKKEADDFVKGEKAKANEVKKITKSVHEEILKQIQNRKKIVSREKLMNERELLINKKILESASFSS